jgi:plasmid stabilization system protein ParE
MKKIEFTNQALIDLEGIWLYHAEYSSDFASLIESLIYETSTRIAEAPFSFPKREDLTSKDYRFCLVNKYSYYLIFDAASDPINVMRVVSSKRDIASIL